MKKQTGTKLLSCLAAAAIVLSGLFIGVPILASAEPLPAATVKAIREAAAAYVADAKNDVTPEDLLAAVNEDIAPLVATLDAKTDATSRFVTNLSGGACTDFFIKHSVPGVKDKYVGTQPAPQGDIPLDIKGSDGAVAAILKVGAETVGVSAAFAHDYGTGVNVVDGVEVIEVHEVAVVGVHPGFTYASGVVGNDVTGFDKTTYPYVDKIVIPSTYGNKTVANFADRTQANNIKVAIIDKSEILRNDSFRGWTGLKAMSVGPNASNVFPMFSADGGTYTANVFNDCTNLKYAKLADRLNWTEMGYFFGVDTFLGCSSLENVNMPSFVRANRPYGAAPFTGAAVRDFFLPLGGDPEPILASHIGATSLTTGTVNVTEYTTDMTLTRAAALAAAKVNEEMRLQSAPDKNLLIESAKTAITGASNAATFRDAMSFSWGATWSNSDAAVGGVLTVSKDSNSIPITIGGSKALASLDVGYALTPEFNPGTLNYTVNVPASVTSLTVDAQSVEGATVGTITGNSGFTAEGSNVVSIPVTTSESKTVTYTITVTLIMPKSLPEAAADYVASAKNDVTPEALLAAVNDAIAPLVATLDAKTNATSRFVTNLNGGLCTDFFIKHSVPGVKDKYVGSQPEPEGNIPLDIKGSDGAVAAVFKVGNEEISFSAAFTHDYGAGVNVVDGVEVIEVHEVAIVGTHPGFTYASAGGHVTGFNKTTYPNVDKIIIPSSYQNTVADFTTKADADNIKVAIIDNRVMLPDNSFRGWTGLKAMSVSPNADNDVFCMFAPFGGDLGINQFRDCKKLKYAKIADRINFTDMGYSFSADVFTDCTSLENVNMPSVVRANLAYGTAAFSRTTVRDFFLPKDPGSDTLAPVPASNIGATSLTTGTVNVTEFTTDMTLTRAAALAAAKVNEKARLQSAHAQNDSVLREWAKSAITGAHNILPYQDVLDFTLGAWTVKGANIESALTITRSDRGDAGFTHSGNPALDPNVGDAILIPLSISNKTLASLSVEDTDGNEYDLDPAFSPNQRTYATEDVDLASLKIIATPVSGATCAIRNNGGSDTVNLVTGSNTFDIDVTPSDGSATVTYTINITRLGTGGLAQAATAVKSAAAAFNATNNVTEASFQLAMQSAAANAGGSLTLTDFYIYRAIGGAQDISSGTPEIMVPGHTGYITAIARLTKGDETPVNIPLKLTIQPDMENYTFTSAEVSKASDFKLSGDGKTLEWYTGSAKKIVIPDGVESIESGWFDGDNLNDVVAVILPDSVEVLPSGFVSSFKHLEAVHMGDKITELPSSAFEHCYFLQYVRLSESLKNIQNSAFVRTQSLGYLHLPETVEWIGGNAFFGSGVRNFTLTNVQRLDDAAIAYQAKFVAEAPEIVYADDAADRVKILANLKKFRHLTRIVTVLNPNMYAASASSIEVEGAPMDWSGPPENLVNNTAIVRAPAASAVNTFPPEKRSPYSSMTFKFDLDMKLAEAAVRAQYKADHLYLTESTTAADVVKEIKASYYIENADSIALAWKTGEEFARSEDGGFTGVVTLSANNVSFDVVIGTDIQEERPEPEIPGNNPLSIREGSTIAQLNLDSKKIKVLKNTTIANLQKDLILKDGFNVKFYDAAGDQVLEADYDRHELANGDTMKVLKSDGSVYATFTIEVVNSLSGSPETGDSDLAVVLLLSMLLASATVCGITVKRKKRTW